MLYMMMSFLIAVAFVVLITFVMVEKIGWAEFVDLWVDFPMTLIIGLFYIILLLAGSFVGMTILDLLADTHEENYVQIISRPAFVLEGDDVFLKATLPSESNRREDLSKWTQEDLIIKGNATTRRGRRATSTSIISSGKQVQVETTREIKTLKFFGVEVFDVRIGEIKVRIPQRG